MRKKEKLHQKLGVSSMNKAEEQEDSKMAASSALTPLLSDTKTLNF